MANSAAQSLENQDMSMEDILQSIRKIIAEDAPVGDKAASSQAEAFGSDVLELTELADEPAPQATAQTPLEEAGFDILAQIDSAAKVDISPAFQPEESVQLPPNVMPLAASQQPTSPEQSTAPVALNASVEAGERLISDNAAHLSAASLKRMLDTHKAATPMPHFRNGTTLEEIVLESLKPMLKEWLDANLPSMVERLVEREIRKLVE